YHHNAGRADEAERLYRDILRRSPGHPVAATLLARLALKRGDFSKARALLMVAVAKAPDYMQAHVALGECHEQAWAQGPATRAYRRALALAPEQAGTLVTLGNLEQQANNDNVAGALYRRALVIQPGSVAAANNLAAACLKCADPIRALDATDRVLESNPSHVRAIAYRTVALRALGRDAEADRFLGFGSLVTSTRLDPSSRYSDLAEFNGDLADALMTHPNISSEWDSAKRAIRGGAIVPRLLEHRVPVIEAFETFLRATINGAIAALPDDRSHPYLARKPEADERGRYALDIWGNLLGRSDHQSAHIHNLGWMSGVYYVTVPVPEPDEDPRAGWIEFNRPGYGISVLGGEAGIEVIRPEPGMVILFPSYVWHGTIPFNGPGQRVSIAFDLHLPTS
ncbi:MAG: putative 2OG-Fe(II) oxygenase, partial [Alphaproteobacteria bacterium]|nr:putative 2OG-Fe(II) oxygenase [Alphaproteobacteria bacterium]